MRHHRFRDRRRGIIVLIMLASIAMVLGGLVIEFSVGGRSERWSDVSIGLTSTGLATGIGAYVASRFD